MDAPRREAAQTHDIWGIGYRQPADGWWWQVAGGPARAALLAIADPAEAGKGRIAILAKV
jgi:hypothetical protein